MINQEELIKKYIRRELNEVEKETFNQLLNEDAQFADNVNAAVKFTAARHLQLKQGLNAAYEGQRSRRLGTYLALAGGVLLIVVGFYFNDSIKKALFPTNQEPMKMDMKTPIVEDDTLKIELNQIGTHKIDFKSSKDSTIKSPKPPSVFELKNKKKEAENKGENAKNQDFDRLQAVISEFANRETYAGNAKNDWRKQLFNAKNYAAALATIRQETATTTDELTLNKLHLFGGILNVSILEGNQEEGIIWLKAVIENGDYADYAAEFLVKTYMELGETDKAKEVLLKFPDVKEKLPVYLQKRL